MGMVRELVRRKTAAWLVAVGLALIIFAAQLHGAAAAGLSRPVPAVRAFEIGSWWQWFWGSYGCFFDWACK